MSIYHLLTLSISNSSREQPTACAPTYSPYAEQLSQWSPIITVGSPHPVAFHEWSLTSLWHATLLATLFLGTAPFLTPLTTPFWHPPTPPAPFSYPHLSPLVSALGTLHHPHTLRGLTSSGGSPSSCKQQLPTTSFLKIEPTFPIACSVLVSSP